MDRPRDRRLPRYSPPESPRRRSLSAGRESEEERERRRRRRERQDHDYGSDRSGRNEGSGRRSSHRDKYDDHSRKRNRSRSPVERSSKRQDGNRESRYGDVDRASRNLRNKRDRHEYGDAEVEKQVSLKKNGPLPSQEASYSMTKDPSQALILTEDKPVPEKQKPNLAPSGLLAAASNTVQQVDGTAIVLKYHEPPEARKPPSKDQWKLFVFKGADIVDTIDLSQRSCWLIGRERSVVDLSAEHPSISKQHAVIQFRYIEKKNEFGDKLGKVKPYLIDLESANGTMLNKELIPSSRYLELRDTDMIQFGESSREYVLMLPPKD